MPQLAARVPLLVVTFLACVGLSGCTAVANAVFDYPDRCRDNCDQTYHACLDQMATPDANHYCLNRRNQCVSDC